MLPRPDPTIERLAELFAHHPVWLGAARPIAEGACSRVRFSHRPDEEWTLVREGDESRLQPGPCPDPDLEFVFTPAAVEALAAVEGDVGDFAVTLFELALAADPERRVDVRVVAPFSRLARRGYVRLLITGGPKVLRFGAAHGVRGLGGLRRLVERLRRTSR